MVQIALDENIRVWYLWHPDTKDVFSGYGLGESNDYLIGILMVDRPRKAPIGYLNQIKKAFGECQLYPMATDGCRGILCQMSIEEESRKYVKNFEFSINAIVMERFSPLLENKPNPHFLMQYSHMERLWLSEFYFPENHQKGDINPDRNKL